MTSEELKNELTYNPESGSFFWARAGQGRSVNNPAGDSNSIAGRRISLNGRKWRTPTLAWLYMSGSMPDGVVIPIDGNVRNDRWSNLKCISTKEYRTYRRKQIMVYQDKVNQVAAIPIRSEGVYRGPATWTEVEVRKAIDEFILSKVLTAV